MSIMKFRMFTFLLFIMLVATCWCAYSKDITVSEVTPTFEFEHSKGQFTDGLSFSSDSKFLVASGDSGKRVEGILVIFDVKSGKLLNSIPGAPSAYDTTCTKDGLKIYRITDDKFLRIHSAPKWNVETSIQIPGKTAVRLFLSPDDTILVTAAYHGILVWEIKTRTSTAVESQGQGVTGLAFSSDGKEFAASYSGSRTVEMYRLGEIKPYRILEGHVGGFLSVRYSPDLKTLATGFSKKLEKDEQATPVMLWDVATGKLLHKCEGPPTHRQSNDFTNDSKYIIGLSNQLEGYPGVVSVWEVKTGKLVYQWKTDKPCVTFALSPDNTSLITCNQDGKLHRWDFETIRKQFDKK